MTLAHEPPDSPRKHIILTVNAAWNALNFRRTLLRELLGDGHAVTVLAPADESVPQLLEMGCRFAPLAMSPSGLSPRDAVSLVSGMRKAFRELRPDVVLSYTIKNNIFGALAAKSLGIAFIPNVTGLGTAFLSGRFLETIAVMLYRAAFRNLPVIFFQNDEDLKLFVQRKLVDAAQARLLPGSGINLSQFAPAPVTPSDQGVTFLMIGRLLRDKGVIEFAEAARMLKAHSGSLRFQLLGALGADNVSAIDKSTLDSWVAEGIVEYLGVAKDVRPHIAAAHCVVLPSYREGAPRTLLEAAAMSRPVIATDVPGCRSVVDRDVSGFLCEAKSATSLASAMQRFLACDETTRRAMGDAGRRKMEGQFDEAHVVARYREAIASLPRL